jgi:hypothetical protein
VDLYHAREHLHDLADHLAFIVCDPPAWLAERLADLDAGDIRSIVETARAYPLVGVKATELNTKIGYFETNAVCMRYAYYRDLGMFVGSGTVEAGCKNVIGARMKQSGMRWTIRGADAISHLRCVAVGTALTGGPPHRSQRAELPHWAPASGSGSEAHLREGMHHASSR